MSQAPWLRRRAGFLLMVFAFGATGAPAVAQVSGSSDAPQIRVVVGQAIDHYGNALAHALIRAVSFDRKDSTYADESGRFVLRTSLPRFNFDARKVADRTLFVMMGPEPTYQVAADDTLEVLLDVRRGNCLHVQDIRSDPGDLSKGPVTLQPGESLSVEITYRLWVRWTVPQSDMHLVMGFDEEPAAYHIIGTPGTYPGTMARAVFDMTAPLSEGRYTVYLGLIPKSDRSREVLFHFYRILAQRNLEVELIPLGEIIVLRSSEGTVAP